MSCFIRFITNTLSFTYGSGLLLRSSLFLKSLHRRKLAIVYPMWEFIWIRARLVVLGLCDMRNKPLTPIFGDVSNNTSQVSRRVAHLNI